MQQEQEKPDPSLAHFIVTRGEDMWLKMVLHDGLLHADLHPVRVCVNVYDAEFCGSPSAYRLTNLERLADGLGCCDHIIPRADRRDLF